MAKAKVKKKNSKRTAQGVETQIVEVSLQHPDFGARRLAPLLKKKRITVSAATIQSILRREGLQNREKRLAKLEAQSKKARKPKPRPRKPAAKITADIAERICEISLQYPDFGARRLTPLLQHEDIGVSTSAVYRTLKRNNLENRQKRLLELEARMDPEAITETEVEIPELLTEAREKEPTAAGEELPEQVFGPAAAAPISPEDEAPAPADIPAESMAQSGRGALVEPEPLSPRKPPVKPTKRRSHPVFYPLYLLLFVLIGYMGVQAFHAVQYARSETGTVPAFAPAAAGIVAKAESAAAGRPLNGYRAIWERNLFDASGKPAQQKEIAVEKLALAEKDLGLTLVGTVFSGDARLRRAFIYSDKARRQEAFREGDAAGAVRIKKILRNKVVVATRDGDRVLSADVFETGRRAAAPGPPQPAAASSPFAQAAGSGGPEVGIIEASLKRAQVESGLSENDHLMKQVRVFPYTDAQGVPQGGFRLSYLMAGNVLVQMGLRSGDVILGVNGEAVAGPDDAAGFFEKLAQGGDVTIQAMRRGRPVQLQLKIQ